jgi:cysteine desulfurase
MRAYLDHNATTAVRPEVIDAMAKVMAETGNPSSVHQDGQSARRHVESARRSIGKALCVRAEDIIFTSCGTEALNLALTSMVNAGCGRLLVSAIEHSAVAQTARETGAELEEIPVSSAGVLDVNWVRDRLAHWNAEEDGIPGVALMMVNNETGVIQPVAETAALVREAGGRFLVDAIQAVGKIPVDFAAIGCDYMSISSHKFGGPQGVGALLAACDAPLTRTQHGGGQEQGRRSGTLNVAGIAGMGVALQSAMTGLDAFAALARWRNEIETALTAAAPGAVVLGREAPRLPNTLSIATPDWRGETQVMALDLAGVSISAGAACSSGKAKGSKVGAAMGIDPALAHNVVRISLGWNSTREDVDAVIRAWTENHARVAQEVKVTA